MRSRSCETRIVSKLKRKIPNLGDPLRARQSRSALDSRLPDGVAVWYVRPRNYPTANEDIPSSRPEKFQSLPSLPRISSELIEFKRSHFTNRLAFKMF